MELKREPIDVDLYVEHRPPTEKDMKEMAEFIENYKKTHNIKYPKIKPAATIKKVKKPARQTDRYEIAEANEAFAMEPEPDLYRVNKGKQRIKAKRTRKKVKVAR